jgi:hypothetical protein
MNVDYKENNSLLIVDENDFYYIFDLYPFIKTNKLPFIEMTFNTFLFSQILSFIINILLVKFLDSSHAD